jgi:sensor histidine kinase regulating citrate/malate metabolism
MCKKKNKGQSSFDFIIAIIFAIIFFQAFSIISDQIITMQEETAIRAQTKEIALNTAAIISASQALNETEASFEIAYKTAVVKTLTDRPKDCKISITASEVQVKLDIDPPETAVFMKPAGITINKAELNCGDTINISK